MKKKSLIIFVSVLIALIIGGIVVLNKPKPSPELFDAPLPVTEMSDEDKADMAINDELNELFKEADDHFVKGDFDGAIASYKKITSNPKYSMVDYGEYMAPGLAEGSIEEVKCVQKYETSKVARTPEEAVQGLLESLHKNVPEALDYISCRVCESAWLDTTCNFLERDSVPAALLGKDLDRGLLAKINPGAKTFLKEESAERGTLYRVTNETEATNDDVLLHLGAHPFAPERFRVEDIYRMEKEP